MIKKDKIEVALSEIMTDVETLLTAPLVLLGHAEPPTINGVYIFVHNNDIAYIGEAKGSGGLRDRLLRKHLSGDDNHALQRAFKDRFPDRKARREYLKVAVYVRWVGIEDPDRVSAVERFMIWILRPKWNMT